MSVSWARLFRFAMWAGFGLTAACTGLAVIAYFDTPDDKAGSILGILMAIVFGAMSYSLLRIVRRMPQSGISVDRDGLWYAHREKRDALVPWSAITAIRESHIGQRFVLLDASGAELIRVEYQLEDFEHLRDIIYHRVELPRRNVTEPTVIGRTAGYHAFRLFFIAFGISIAWFVRGDEEAIYAYLIGLILAGPWVYEYVAYPAKLVISRYTFEIVSPLRKVTLSPADVSNVRVTDKFVRGTRHSFLEVAVLGREKPIKLEAFEVDNHELFRLIKAWRHGLLFQPDDANDR